MKTIAVAFVLAALMSVSHPLCAQDYTDNDTPMLSAAESAKLKAERAAARAEWARMTPAERADVKQAAKEKRFADLSALEMHSDNDTVGLGEHELATPRADAAEARAQWAALTPVQKANMQAESRQMKLSQMSMLQKIAGSGS